jgi:hypothetical protein
MGGRKGGEGSDGGQDKHQSSGHKIFSRSCQKREQLHFSNFLRDGLGMGGRGAVVTLGARPAPSPRLSFELYTTQSK